MPRILLVTGLCGTGKTTLLQEAAAHTGWKCRMYDGMDESEQWSLPVHPLEVELVAIDHVAGAPAFQLQALFAWCVKHGVGVVLAEQRRDDIERVLGPLPADELRLPKRGENATLHTESGMFILSEQVLADFLLPPSAT